MHQVCQLLHGKAKNKLLTRANRLRRRENRLLMRVVEFGRPLRAMHPLRRTLGCSIEAMLELVMNHGQGESHRGCPTVRSGALAGQPETAAF